MLKKIIIVIVVLLFSISSVLADECGDKTKFLNEVISISKMYHYELVTSNIGEEVTASMNEFTVIITDRVIPLFVYIKKGRGCRKILVTFNSGGYHKKMFERVSVLDLFSMAEITSGADVDVVFKEQ